MVNGVQNSIDVYENVRDLLNFIKKILAKNSMNLKRNMIFHCVPESH